MAYNIIFYEKNGQSQIWDYLEQLRLKSLKNKDARIQYNQMILSIELLAQSGTYLPESITKHISGDIWELRPGNNRVFYFCYDNNNFVLLHYFRKKTKKTPLREIKKAQSERDDYISRKENDRYEDMG